MIPGKIIRFLEERACIAFAGVRDANCVPRGHRVSGWLIGDGGRTMTVLIPASWVPHLVESLQENGRVAVTLEEIGTHETYQLKGRYMSHRPVRPTDLEVANRMRERFAKCMRSVSPPGVAELLTPSLAAPSLAVEIEVLEVFLQTPGPGAGTRLAPPSDAEVSAP